MYVDSLYVGLSLISVGYNRVEPLVVVVHGYGEDLLGMLLPHHIAVQVAIDLGEVSKSGRVRYMFTQAEKKGRC